MLQRFYRRNDAARYVGMSTYLFDELVHPYLTAFPNSNLGIAFDRSIDRGLPHVQWHYRWSYEPAISGL